MSFDGDLIFLDGLPKGLGEAGTQAVPRFVREAPGPGRSSLVISRRIHHVLQVSNRIAAMQRGAIVACGPSPRASSIQQIGGIVTGRHLAA